MSIRNRLQGRQTQFHIEILYGILFVAGFAYLAFRVDPRVAAFEGGLVVGYLLRVWEKMSIYERTLEAVVSREAEAQVADEAAAQVADEVAAQVDDEFEAQFADEMEEQVAQEVTTEVEAQVADEVEAELDERIDEQVAERLENREEVDRHST